MTLSDQLCIHARITGKVQGVFFRASTCERARTLELTGWVRNTKDGDVELIACGKRDHIMELTEWLWEGPKAAKVNNVHWEEVTCDEEFDGFATRENR